MLMRRSWYPAALAAGLIGCTHSTPPAASPAGGSPAASTPAATATPAAPATPTATASATPGTPKKITTVEGITEYQLDNGLRVLLFPDPSKTTVTVNITYMVGSRFEGYGETGMAHLLEHMQFKGTPTRKEIWADLQQHGAQFNASTGYDRTNYFETLTATDENVNWALDLEADRMTHSNIANEELQKEFSVVRNEFEADENNPANILNERVLSTAYLWHNYGKSVIGSRSDIERVPAENLRRFYEKFYQPDNAVLVVAGKIDPDKILSLVNQKFGVTPRPTRKLPSSYTVEPIQDGERVVTLRRNGDVQYVELAYHTVAGPDEDFVATEAIGHLLTAQPSGRLYKALVSTGMATSVGSGADAMAEPGTLVVFAEVPAGKPLEPVRDKMIAIVEGLGDPKSKPTDEEIKRFQAEESKDFDLAMTNNQRIAMELSEWQAQGDWRLIFVHRDRIEKLDAAHTQKVAAKYLKQSNRTTGMFIPTKTPDRSPMPDRPDVTALVGNYKGRAAVSEGEAFESTTENIEKHTTRTTIGGVKMAMLPKTTRGKGVHVTFTLHYGSEKDLTGRTDAEDFVPDMLMRGTSKHTYQQIKDELDRLKAQVSIGGGGRIVPQHGSVTVTITTVRENLPAVMALVAEILKEPTFPQDQFDIVKKEGVTALNEQVADPQAQAVNSALRKLFPFASTDVRYVPTTKEEIDRTNAVKLDDVKKFYKDFYGASNGEMAVVGDFDPKELSALVETHFGKWKSPKAFKRIEGPFKANTTGDEIIDTPDKEGGFLVVVQAFAMRDDDPDYVPLQMANFILGGGASSRINDRLRQKEGWSYGSQSIAQASPLDKHGLFLCFALVAPQNAGKAMVALIEEVVRFIKDGPTDDELEKAKKGYKNSFDTRLSNDGATAGSLATGLYLGRTMAWDQKQVDLAMKLTTDDVKKVLAKGYIKPEAFAKITAADQKKAKAGGDAGKTSAK